MDPARVREARRDARLSLAQVAGDDFSRTFLHLVEHGRSRPSKGVLALIAKRTGRPVSFFIAVSTLQAQSAKDLARELVAIADRVRSLMAETRITRVDREALKLLELTMRQGAELALALDGLPKRRSKSAVF